MERASPNWFGRGAFFNELEAYGNINLLEIAAIFAAYQHYHGDLQWLHRRIDMLDDLGKLKYLQEIREAGVEKGRQEGRQEGLEEGLEDSIMDIIRIRFPVIEALALPRVQKIHKVQALKALRTQLLLAPDETTALRLLGIPAA